MKKLILPSLICVIFLLISSVVGATFCYSNEEIVFHYNNKIFSYNLVDNIKTNKQFDINYEINRHKRFSSKQDRQQLLKHLIEIGIDKSVALEYLFPNINKTIETIKKCVEVENKDAQLSINTNREQVFQIKPEQIGQTLNTNELYTSLCNNYITDKPLNFDLPLIKSFPKITTQDLKKFTNLRADFSTNISSSTADRKHNIKNALASLNKVEIAPNQMFSFNKSVGRRTQENGYRTAKIIINNEFVDGIGGGVCQVSSTLYNTALLAGLKIVEANKHSKPVSYVSPGFDAMVNFGSSDLKFINNTNEKLTIISNFSSTTARIRIYGEEMKNVKYKLRNEIFNVSQPTEEIYEDEKQEYLDKVEFDDEYFYLKKGAVGMEIKTYRDTYINNTLQNSELLRHDKFKTQNAIKIYGTKKREICFPPLNN